MTNPNFPDLAPFPAPAGPGHNQPPLEDAVLLDFDEAIRNRGLDKRIEEIRDAAERVPEIESPETAGQVGDLIAMARAAKLQVEGERETLNRPLLTAQRALKAKADGFIAPMEGAIAAVRARLDEYIAAHADEKTVGDYGARVGSKTEWQFEISDFGKLPLSIRKHPDVIAAMEKVIRGLIRGGARKIAGVRIWPAKAASVR